MRRKLSDYSHDSILYGFEAILGPNPIEYAYVAWYDEATDSNVALRRRDPVTIGFRNHKRPNGLPDRQLGPIEVALLGLGKVMPEQFGLPQRVTSLISLDRSDWSDRTDDGKVRRNLCSLKIQQVFREGAAKTPYFELVHHIFDVDRNRFVYVDTRERLTSNTGAIMSELDLIADVIGRRIQALANENPSSATSIQ
jgi:hypothetical protein